MKAMLLSAGLAAALIAGAVQAGETPLQQVLRAPRAPVPFLLAQYDRPRPTCKDDERDMPQGARVCRNGRLLVCGARGQWEDIAKAC